MTDDVHAEHDADARIDARLSRAGAIWRASVALEAVGTADAVESPPVVIAEPGPVPSRRWRPWLIASAAVVAAVLVLAGTFALRELRHGAPAGTGGPIAGRLWTLSGYGSDQLDPSSNATFRLGRDGHLIADDTCEIVTAEVKPSAGRLEVSHLIVRDRSCTDSVGEVTFTSGLAVLRSNPAYSVSGDHLSIGNGSDAMDLRSAPVALPLTTDLPTFQQSTWRLEKGFYSDGVASYRAGASFRPLVVGVGRLSTGAGSATIRADVTVDGDRVTIDDLVEGSGGPDEQSPLQNLVRRIYTTGSITQSVIGTTLTVMRRGRGSLVYRWVPGDARATRPTALTGRTWYVRSVVGSPAVGVTARLRFAPDGTLRGSDGCRPISGRAVIYHGSMRITGVDDTTSETVCSVRGGAPGLRRDRASTLDSYLQGNVLWSIRERRLVIGDGGAQADAIVLDRTPTR